MPAEKIEGSVRYFEKQGYRVTVGPHASKIHGYLAGTDAERAGDLNRFIQDKEVRAIFALRGGYGTPRILDQVDYRELRRHPKIISGFSDITALLLAIYRKCKLATFSGPMPAVEFWKEPDPYTEEEFWALLTSPKKNMILGNPPDDPISSFRKGSGSGILLGGNLSLVVSLLGTPYIPSLRDAVLVLEEIQEVPYRVDRMFSQLKNSGVLRSVAALMLGKFTHCEPEDLSKPCLPLEKVLSEYASLVAGPVLSNLAYGHVAKKLTMPFGLPARIDGSKGSIRLLESAVE
jgi:muramoyltetrapeptide carboxypeptidase